MQWHVAGSPLQPIANRPGVTSVLIKHWGVKNYACVKLHQHKCELEGERSRNAALIRFSN